MARPDEDGLIARFFRPLAWDEGADNLTDDAALVTGGPFVVTKDMLVAGVHFFADDPPDLIARKALRVNLSDLAAKGARPRGIFLGLGLPPDWCEDWLEAFARGLGEDCRAFNCPLLGGDTVKTPVVTLSITAMGVPEGVVPRRKGGRSGQVLAVTGTIGDAALGLSARRNGFKAQAALWDVPESAAAALEQRYLLPQPRVALAGLVAEHASASMDISDGLLGDVARMMKASGCRAVIAADKVPLSDSAQAVLSHHPALLQTILTGGDDYELLLAIPAERMAAFAASSALLGVPLTAIGHIEAGEGVDLRGAEGIAVSGWKSF